MPDINEYVLFGIKTDRLLPEKCWLIMQCRVDGNRAYSLYNVRGTCILAETNIEMRKLKKLKTFTDDEEGIEAFYDAFSKASEQGYRPYMMFCGFD